MNEEEIKRRAADHWSKVTAQSARKHWWQSQPVVEYVNTLVARGGPVLPGLHSNFHALLRERLNGRVAERAASVGCGLASKELRLLATGLVRHFDLFELSTVRVEQAKARAAQVGVADRITFYGDDPFAAAPKPVYDLVYWNNSLHHMLDVEQAIAWSVASLVAGGLFAMDDFVGPSRFQWTDRMLDYASKFRAGLPDRLLQDPHHPGKLLPRHVSRPSVSGMIAMDPTEAADSGRILECLSHQLPDADVIKTGGAIYVVGAGSALGNFEGDEETALLKSGFVIDKALIDMGETLYAVAIAAR